MCVLRGLRPVRAGGAEPSWGLLIHGKAQGEPARRLLQNASPASGRGGKICCSSARLGLSFEKRAIPNKVLVQFPDVNVMVLLMLYLEGETLVEHNLGQSLKQTNKVKWEAIKSWLSDNYGLAWEGQKCALPLIVKNEITSRGLAYAGRRHPC